MSKETERKTVEIIIKGQQANSSLKEMEASVRLLNSQLKKLPANSAEFAEKTKELQQVNKRLKSIQNDVKGVGGVFSQISKEVKAFGLLAIAALGFQAITAGVGNLISQNAKLSDSFADIRKTTGMTEAEVRRLNNAFSQMNTRTSTKELRDIAIAAGQLGIAKKDILSFTEATDKLVVALGDEFQGGAEQVTKEMGALRNIFTDIKSKNIADDMLHIGNAINELASSGAATGPVVSDFANRIGGVGINLGLTSGQVLGLSATLQELNVSTERGGTAVSKILMKMAQDTDKFSKVADMSAKGFKELVNKDLYGAFVKVAEGSKKSGTSATEFSKILDTLGVDGAGASEVFSKLGANTDLLAKKVNLANTSLKGTDSIMNEFNIKNETFGAKVDKIGKSLTTAFVNGPVMKGLNWLADGLVKLTTNTHASSEAMAEEQNQVELSKIKILSYNVGNEERTRLLTELKDQYPEYLANLDAEKASNDQVREAIDSVVSSLVNKIVVQRKQEEIAEQAEQTADKKEKQLLAETELLQALNLAYKDNDHAYRTRLNNETRLMSKELENLPLQLQAEELIISKNSGLSSMNDNIVNVVNALESWKQAESAYNSESMKGNDIQKEKDELMKRLGINKPGSANKTDENKPTGDQRSKDEEQVNQKIIDERKKFLEKVAELEIEYYQKGLDSDTKEIADVHQKYESLLKEAGNNSEALVRIKKLYVKEIEAVIQKQAEEEQKKNAEKLAAVQKLQDEIYVATLSANDQVLVAEMNKWDDLIAKAEAAGLDTTRLRQAEADAINAIVVAQGQKEVDSTKKAEDQKEAIRKEKLQKISKAYDEFASRVNGVMDAYLTLQKARDQQELNSNDAKLKSEQSNNDELFRARLITQQQHDKKAIALQNERDKKETAIKQKAAEREKKFAIAKAIINGISTVIRDLASYAYPYNLVVAAIDAALIGGEIAMMQSAPAYAEGGFNKTSNDPQGYTSGSTLFTNSASGENFIAGEAGREWIAPNWMTTAPETAPIIEHLEAVRQNRAFKWGGTTGGPFKSDDGGKHFNGKLADKIFGDHRQDGKDSPKLTQSIDTLNKILDNISENGIQAYLDYDQYTRTRQKIDNAKNASRVGN